MIKTKEKYQCEQCDKFFEEKDIGYKFKMESIAMFNESRWCYICKKCEAKE